MRLAHMLVVAAALAACADKPGKEEQEAAKNTFVCLLESERLVIRFDMGIARMLMPKSRRPAARLPRLAPTLIGCKPS